MNCVICLEPVSDGITCQTCKTVIHRECWNAMQDKITCPYCRSLICNSDNVKECEDWLLYEYQDLLTNDIYFYVEKAIRFMFKLFNCTFVNMCKRQSIVLDILEGKYPFLLTNMEDGNYEFAIRLWCENVEKYGIAFDLPFRIEECRYEMMRRSVSNSFLCHHKLSDIEKILRYKGKQLIDARIVWDVKDSVNHNNLIAALMKEIYASFKPLSKLHFPCEYPSDISICSKCKTNWSIRGKCDLCDHDKNSYRGISTKLDYCGEHKYCLLCGSTNPTVLKMKTKLQAHRIPPCKRKHIMIIYCHHCMRAYYCTYADLIVYEVDPPFEEIKDYPINTIDIFNYSRYLTRKLLSYKKIDHRLSKLLTLGCFDYLKDSKRIILAIHQLDSHLINPDNMTFVINESRKIVLPYLLVQRHSDTIIRVLNGDDPNLLRNVFGLLHMFGY